MTTWYYEKNSEREGPIAESVLYELLESKTISHDTLVWSSDLTDWTKACEVQNFTSIFNKTTPKEPPSLKRSEQDSQNISDISISAGQSNNIDAAEGCLDESDTKVVLTPAGPWRRYFARLFDLFLFGLLSGLIFGYVTAVWFPDVYNLLFVEIENKILANIIYLPMALIVEALVYSVFGSTPGKYLLGIKVVDMLSNKLMGMDYFYRNMSVWCYGLGFGLPLISLITMAKQHGNLKNKGSTGYDLDVKHRVLVIDTSYLRTVLFIVGIIVLFFVAQLFMLIDAENKLKVMEAREVPSASEIDSHRSITDNDRFVDADRIMRELKEAEIEVKAATPRIIDEDTTLLGAKANGLTFTYYYKLPNIAFDDFIEDEYNVFEDALRNILAENFCTNEYMINYSNQGVIFYYNYKGHDDIQILNFEFPAYFCYRHSKPADICRRI